MSQGKSLEGTGRNPGLDPGCVGSIRGYTNRERDLESRLEGRANTIRLSAQVPPDLFYSFFVAHYS